MFPTLRQGKKKKQLNKLFFLLANKAQTDVDELLTSKPDVAHGPHSPSNTC